MTEVLTTDPMPRRSVAHDAPVVVEEESLETWLLERARILALSRQQAERLAASVGQLNRPVAFASTTEMGSAQGRAVLMDGWVGIFDMLTEPVGRRKGLGRAVLGSLLDWGAAHGAERAFLQVEAGNEPAVALYSEAGFELAYRYAYWRASEFRQPLRSARI